MNRGVCGFPATAIASLAAVGAAAAAVTQVAVTEAGPEAARPGTARRAGPDRSGSAGPIGRRTGGRMEENHADRHPRVVTTRLQNRARPRMGAPQRVLTNATHHEMVVVLPEAP